MPERSKGLFSGMTRHLARHHKPSKLRIRDLIKSFDVGEKVAVVPKGSFRDIPHPRYRGKIGVVKEKRGNAYVVEVNSMSAKRLIIVNNRHLEHAAANAKKKGK